MPIGEFVNLRLSKFKNSDNFEGIGITMEIAVNDNLEDSEFGFFQTGLAESKFASELRLHSLASGLHA
jgi:hypothetical protein